MSRDFLVNFISIVISLFSVHSSSFRDKRFFDPNGAFASYSRPSIRRSDDESPAHRAPVSRRRTMRDNDLPPILPPSPPSGLLALVVVFGSVLVGLWTPISTAHVGPDRREKAVLDIVVLQRRNGTLVLSDTIQLAGVFSSAGTIEYAKGYLRQVSWFSWLYVFCIRSNCI